MDKNASIDHELRKLMADVCRLDEESKRTIVDKLEDILDFIEMLPKGHEGTAINTYAQMLIDARRKNIPRRPH